MKCGKRRVLYSARTLGGWSGGRLSPLDWLEGFAALDPSIKVTIMTESSRKSISDPIANSKRIKWLRVRFQNQENLPNWIRKLHTLYVRCIVARLAPEIVIAEGRRGHKLAKNFRARGRRADALVVRGQPSQYEEEVADKDRLSLMTTAIEASDTIIFNSPTVQRDWQERGLIDAKRCFQVPNTSREDVVDLLRRCDRDDVRRGLGIRSGSLVILCLGTILYRKGQDLLLDGWPAIASAVPDAELHLVGPVSGRANGQSIAERAAKMPDVLVTGPRQDAMDYIYAADLLVLPSRGESMPRVILEAMALGTPVAASTVGAIPDLIEDRKSGLLFDIGDLQSMTDCIIELGRSADLRRELADHALTRYWESFSRERQRARLRAVVDNLLSESPGPA
jgi:glycosyltransferase involved in cell wall biosynthesis